jgi:uncharacterized FAD-dependent dehydrogenase
VAPAQRLLDFLQGRASTSLPRSSYRAGISAAPIKEVLPAFVLEALEGGLRAMVARYPVLASVEAVLVAPETRTSAPVRILRHSDTLQSPSLAGLYPAGEGAGYAGGIVSAALDGVRIADAIVRVA